MAAGTAVASLGGAGGAADRLGGAGIEHATAAPDATCAHTAAGSGAADSDTRSGAAACSDGLALGTLGELPLDAELHLSAG